MTRPRFTAATALLAAALALLLEAAAPPPAAAFFGFNPCKSCRGYLLFCCPRPCLVRDGLQRARLAHIRATAGEREHFLSRSTDATVRLSATVGPSGLLHDLPPASPPRLDLSAGTGPLADSEPIGLSIPSATAPPDLAPFLALRAETTTRQRLAAVNNATIADTAQALETLSWSLAAAEELVAATSDALPASQDARSMLRRSLEMSLAVQRIIANLSAVRAFRAKLLAQPPLQLPDLLSTE